MTDVILFHIFPYAALTLAVVESLRRYLKARYTYSSLSSQFLEGKQLFYGSVPWHYCILFVLLGHLVAFLIPRQVLTFNSVPLRLYILEVTALVAGLGALIGIVMLTIRRFNNVRIRAVTSPMDIVILLVLLAQVGLGVYIALTLRWGSNWYASQLTPYLYSLFKLQPNVALITPLPIAVKLHVFGAFAFLALLPFSRLVHFLVLPVQYLWLRPQQVIWNRPPSRKIVG